MRSGIFTLPALAFIAATITLSTAAAEVDYNPSDMNPAVIAPDLPDAGPARDDLDRYGGWTGIQGEETGFFHVQKIDDRWWFVTPDGNVYFMLELRRIDKPEEAARAVSWGFNAGEEGSGLPYTVNVNFFRLGEREIPVAQIPGLPPWTTFRDVFDPEWPELCAKQAEEVLGPIKDDPYLVGYYLVNEMSLEGWYEAVLLTPSDAPARAAFVELAREYYAAKPDALGKDWAGYDVSSVDDIMNVQDAAPNIPDLKQAWVAKVAERGFSVASNAARAVDPNHLNLGIRMINAPLPPQGILDAMGKYCDVISMNLYSMLPDRLLTQIFTLVPAISAITGRPTMSTEFSYRGADTLHPNTMGALPSVKTQAERAVAYLSYVAAVASLPTHIGANWYKYDDNPLDVPWDRYDEDCNFGVVDNQNRPYAVLSETMRLTNSLIYDLARDPIRNEAHNLFWRTELMRWDLELDETLLGRMARSRDSFVDPLAAMHLKNEPRRYDPNYWVHFESPTLVINDPRFVGWCQANLHETTGAGERLVLLNTQAWTTFPRSLWLGASCEDPEEPFVLESNAKFIERRLDTTGRLVRITMADGSYVRTAYTEHELRLDRKVPYIDIRFDHDSATLAVTTRGTLSRIGIAVAEGWAATWNDAVVPASRITSVDGLSVLRAED